MSEPLDKRWVRDGAALASYAAGVHSYARVFTTLSGSDLYGFPSEDGDYDIRGAHCLSLKALSAATLRRGGMDTVEGMTITELDRDRSPEMDFVSHDIGKVLRLALNGNGYVLEQITSPLVVETTPWHEELVALAPLFMTRRLYHHYSGFFTNQERLYDGQGTKQVKGLLYQYRVALTGIHALRSGKIEANLQRLNEGHRSPLVAELIARKRAGEHTTLNGDAPFREELEQLRAALIEAWESSALPPSVSASAVQAAQDLVWRCRSAA